MYRERRLVLYRDELMSWGLASAGGGLLGFLVAGAVLDRPGGEGLRGSAIGLVLGLVIGACVATPFMRYRVIAQASVAVAAEKPRRVAPPRTLMCVAIIASLLVGLLVIDPGAGPLPGPMVFVAVGVQNVWLALWLGRWERRTHKRLLRRPGWEPARHERFSVAG